jgi:hypothetical protein
LVRCDCARSVVAPKTGVATIWCRSKINSVQQHHTALVTVTEIVRILRDSWMPFCNELSIDHLSFGLL